MSRRSDGPCKRATKMKQIKFSDQEKHVLVDKVMVHVEKLFSKNAVQFGRNICVMRHNIWVNIAKAVSKVDNTRRTAQDCHNAWNNYKRQIQRKIDEIKKNFFDTGSLEPLNYNLDRRQMQVVRHFKMDSCLKMKTRQLSGHSFDHSSLQKEGNQNSPVDHQMSLPPATSPSVQIHPPLPSVAGFQTPAPQQPMTLVSSSQSPMNVASSIGALKYSPMPSTSHAGSPIVYLHRSSEGQTTSLAKRTVGNNLSLTPEANQFAQIPPPLPLGAASPAPLPVPVTAPSLPPFFSLTRLTKSQSQVRILAPPRSPSAVQTTPLVKKKRPTLSISMTPSCKMSPKSLDEKVEELRREVRYMKKMLEKVNFNVCRLTTMLHK
ncbi:myb-related transcription factor, partner of profilin-like [Xenopus laevis]|uniref:Myb-related transcription factor, partner of profilin-like n=1 Tax=Xenopus laevis TaxID=8355 RepID=A0A8J0TD28_XENLA|nr:myb-related transcription factor, partner of profilin-like [Xenopus laevis]